MEKETQKQSVLLAQEEDLLKEEGTLKINNNAKLPLPAEANR